MIKVPENIPNKKSYRIKKQRFHVVEYTNTTESVMNEVVMSENAIVYIVKGTKIINSDNSTTTVTTNQLFMAPKGHYFMSEYLPNDGVFQSIMLFFNEQHVIDIVASISKSTRIEKMSDVDISVVNCSAQVTHFFESIALINSDRDKKDFTKELMNVKISELIYLLLSDNSTRNQTINFLHRVIVGQHTNIAKVVKENMYNSISLESLARMCNMSVSTFKREFEREYRSSPMQWIMDKKLEKALLLIKTTPKPVTDIAYECGFENYVHFSRRFKARYGQSANNLRSLL